MREKIGIAGHNVAKSHSLKQDVKLSRNGSLININPSEYYYNSGKGTQGRIVEVLLGGGYLRQVSGAI